MTKPKDKEEEEQPKKFAGKISPELLQHAFGTTNEFMPELTVLSAREVFLMSGSDTINRGIEESGKLMEFIEYEYIHELWRTYDTRLSIHNDSVKKIEVWDKSTAKDKGDRPILIPHPGEKPTRPRLVNEPELVLLPDIFQMKLMRYKRSQGGLALNKLYEMASTGIQISVDDSEQGPEYEAP